MRDPRKTLRSGSCCGRTDARNGPLNSCWLMQVKFIGPTDFAAGDWIGVELDLNEGKNNGVVNGVHYFDCREGHGLFVKKAQVRFHVYTTFCGPEAVQLCTLLLLFVVKISYDKLVLKLHQLVIT